MQKLNLPEYNYRIRQKANYTEIFDPARRRYVKLTPEEWVRQHFLNYLITEKNYPVSLISVEKVLKYNKLTKKADIIVYNRSAEPVLIVECKAPEIKIEQKVFDQVARYNFELKVSFLIVTNGLEHYCCKMDYSDNSYKFIDGVPDYNSISL